MTTLNVNLSPTLQSTLGQDDVWAYAVYFDGGGTHWSPLVIDGSVQSSGQVAIDLPDPFDGGKIYIVVQSQDDASKALTAANRDAIIGQESDINANNAEDYDFRYDSFEVTLKGTPNDAGNLTSVNGFGIPMAIDITYSDGSTDSRGYNLSGSDLFSQLPGTADTYTSGPLSGQPRSALSPAEAVGIGSGPYAASDWDAYIGTLKVTDPGVAITGFFAGGADANGVYHNAGFYSYKLEYDASEDVFWLSPQANSEIQGYIKLTPDDLANSIYSTLGDVGIYASKTDADPYQILNHDIYSSGDYSMNSGENNQWGAVLAQFFVGFDGGFYGTEGQSPNPLVTDPIDLDANWNWDPTYAFGQNLAGPLPADHFQDAYNEIFYFNTNSYGWGYSDSLMQHYQVGGPLISVSNPQTAPDPGQNVSAIDLTIYDDSETPGGYVEPVIYNYIAPPAGDQYLVAPTTPSANQIKLNIANATMVLDEQTPLSIDILTGWNGTTPVWQTVDFVTDPVGGYPWVIWQLSYDSGSWSATVSNDIDQGAGQMLITGLPTGDTGVNWFRINVGDGDDKKTYNLYLTTESGGILNPTVSGQEGSLAIDGLGEITVGDTTDTIPVVPISLLYGSTTSVDPDLLVRDPDATAPNQGTPNAPVAGTWTMESVAGFPAPQSVPVFRALAGQDSQVSNSISTNQAEIAFGWTGLNDAAAGTSSWISGYTNKIGALNTAQVNLVQGGQTVASLATSADVDGQWVTQPHHLGNGTYTVTMTEFLAADTTYMTPIGVESSTLTLTVDTPELGLRSVGGAGPDLEGLALMSGAPDAPPGNWVEFQILHSSLFSDNAVVVIYATNEAGELVSRDGLEVGPGVSLEAATRGTIGTVRSDTGWRLLDGQQSVYLEDGEELHFAVLQGDDIIDTDPDVEIVSLPGGAQKIFVGGYVLGAETDNDLTDGATLATAQRIHGQEVMYLDQGAVLDVELFGSAANTNTVGFVRLDLDPESGHWNVGGVPYGDTEAFRQAVNDNLDDGFLVTRVGGEDCETVAWTVAGESGYYAPVLLTESGETFYVGYGNSGGNEYLRTFGHNTFGFEDLTEAEGADFDYNDVVVRIAPQGDDGDLTPGPCDEGPVAGLIHGAWDWAVETLDDIFDFGWLSDPAAPQPALAAEPLVGPEGPEWFGQSPLQTPLQTIVAPIVQDVADHIQDFAAEFDGFRLFGQDDYF